MVLIRHFADTVLALMLLAVMAVELAARTPAAGESATTWYAYAGAVAITAPIGVHRRYPVVASAVVGAAIIGYSVGHFVAFPGYAAFALVFVVSLHTGRGRGAIAFGAAAVALAAALSVQSEATVTTATWVSSMLALAVAWLAGENLRIRQARLVALQERAGRLETEREEQARQAVAEERLRIARELHDIVAHAMSVIAVQAGVANHVIDSRPELARAALSTVETNTRAALIEMRRLLGVLRQENEPSGSLTPAPGLADVRPLVDQFAEAGLRVDLDVVDRPPDVPEGVDLSAFRIIQEGLTNVLRHGGPQASVRISYQPGVVCVAVSDDGRPGSGSADRDRSASGHGLIGMRERVAVFGGTLHAGPRAGGGFEVTATLPYADARATDAPLGSAA